MILARLIFLEQTQMPNTHFQGHQNKSQGPEQHYQFFFCFKMCFTCFGMFLGTFCNTNVAGQEVPRKNGAGRESSRIKLRAFLAGNK